MARVVLPLYRPPERPFSDRPAGILLEPLGDGYWYALNLANPQGVRLLRDRAADRLAAILKSGHESHASNEIDPVDAELRRYGLLPSDSGRSPVRDPAPRSCNVWFHVVNGCSLSCHYCYVPHLAKSASQDELSALTMTSDTANIVLTRLLEYCDRNAISRLHFKFAGGEPTLALQLIESFCCEAGRRETDVDITFGMISNGYFDASTVLPVIRRHKIRLSLSIDGYEASHDRIRFASSADGARAGTWKVILENVDLAISEGLRPYFLYTITAANHRSLGDFADMAHDRRLGFRLSLVRGTIPQTDRHRSEILEALTKLYSRLGETLSSRMPIERFARFAEWDVRRRKEVACGTCQNYFAISEDGQVASCQMRLDRKMGSIVDESVQTVLDRMRSDPEFTALIDPTLKRGGCTRCEVRHVCAGGCPQHSRATFGTVDAPSPWCSVYGAFVPLYIHAIARQAHRGVLSNWQ